MSIDELVKKAFQNKGIEVTIVTNAIYGNSCIIDTTEHDKQIRAKVLDEIDKILLDRFTCDDLRTDWTNADIRETIHFELEQLKEQKNE